MLMMFVTPHASLCLGDLTVRVVGAPKSRRGDSFPF